MAATAAKVVRFIPSSKKSKSQKPGYGNYAEYEGYVFTVKDSKLTKTGHRIYWICRQEAFCSARLVTSIAGDILEMGNCKHPNHLPEQEVSCLLYSR